MLKHIVMWRLKDENKDANAAEMKARLEALPAQIKEIRELEVGINEVDDPAAADVVLITAFNCGSCLETYQQHPAHQEVVAFIRGVVSDRTVVDYQV